MNKEELKKHLKSRLGQLAALINLLETQGENHPEYNRLLEYKDEKDIADSQLQRLEKLM